MVASATLLKAEGIFIDWQTAITTFDTTYKDNVNISAAEVTCQHILYYLWAAVHNMISPIVSIIQSTGHTKVYKNELENKHILSSTFIAPLLGTVAGPSNATLNTLVCSIITIATDL